MPWLKINSTAVYCSGILIKFIEHYTFLEKGKKKVYEIIIN